MTAGAAWRQLRVTVPPFARAGALVHLGALLLLALALSIEHAASRSSAPLGAEIAVLWARLAPALGLIAGALAWSRMRTARLALGTLGAGAARIRLGVLPLAALTALGTLTVPAQGAPSAWVRGDGGWFHLGLPIPDHPGGLVLAVDAGPAWATAAAALVACGVGPRDWSATALATLVMATLLGDAARDGGGLAVLLAVAGVSATRAWRPGWRGVQGHVAPVSGETTTG